MLASFLGVLPILTPPYAPDEDQVADVGFGCKNKSMKDSHHGQVHPPTKASQAYKL
jgi:hypothetical protein